MLRTEYSSHLGVASVLLLISAAAFAQTPPGKATRTLSTTSAPSLASTPSPVDEDCFPACRSGYVCNRGKCVSRCNPPCAANEVCTADAQCVTQAPVAAPAQPTPMYLTAPEPPPPEKPPAEVATFSFVGRVGVQLAGSGSHQDQCEGSGCSTAGAMSTSTSYDMKPAVAIGAELMLKLGDVFRVGPGILHTFNNDVSVNSTDPSTHGTKEAGSLTELNLVAEAIPRVSPIVWLVPRLQLGLSMFSASGWVKEGINSNKNACNDLKSQAAGTSVSVNCNNYENPHIGFNVGAGFGGMFAVAPNVRLRADALMEYFAVALGKTELSGPGASPSQSQKLLGTRFLLMGGVEF